MISTINRLLRVHIEKLFLSRRNKFSYAWVHIFPHKGTYTLRSAIVLVVLMLVGASGAWGQTEIHSLSDINDQNGNYILASDFSTTGQTKNGIGGPDVPFKGTIDGQLVPITGSWTRDIVSYAEDATFKNIIIDNVTIDMSNNHAGAIVKIAQGATRIYNCGINGGTISGGSNHNVGGLVGTLEGTSRVINCYSYANITGGKNKGGIVGNNAVASTQSSLTTMVMNCMFYGDIVDGNTIAPIYGGTEINNGADGLNNYNYYRYRSRYSKEKKITKYNRALAMEEKFITRFERYRLLLNSNKKLAAKYASTDAVTVAPEDMAKWVLETADRTNAKPKPYPVLKAQGKYPSIINYDATNAPDSASVGRLKGGKLGSKTLAVTILKKSQKTTGGQSWPTAAASDVQKTDTILIRTDKDTVRFNYNYDKVQLPYYNDIGTGNYTENRVVTGWKITSITGGTEGTYTESDSWGGYNFADRHCTKKDLYTTSKRVFSQGAYWDVPEGVTAITIEPYWAIANYVSDGTYDVVYDRSYAKQTFTPFGTQYTNNTNIDIYGDGRNQKVYTSIANALAGFDNSSKTVYDQAVVLVGNLHQYDKPTNNDTPYTVMSIDMNHDNEPDYSFIFSHDNRQPISPIRFDFLNIMGIAEAQLPKLTANTDLFRNVSIFNLKGWFEVTNTCVVNFSQFEYDNSTGASNAAVKSPAPLILLGGTYEQIVSTQKATLAYTTPKTKYIHVGSNAWFAKFGNGTHSDGTKFTPHVPISVTGGDYDEFYLSGTYQPNITNMQSDNAECYVNGGRFGDMAGASLEAIRGDVRWQIDWADITNFYGGGVNANNPITGDIKVDMTRSHVKQYCGGPKFGDMSTGKNVTTNATDCTFGTFFGAGFGGNSYNRVKYFDVKDKKPSDYQSQYTNDRGKYYDGGTTYANSGQKDYGRKGKGVATDFDYEFFIWSSGTTGARFYVQFVSFSLARTNNVTSNLTSCTINENFYGGGNLGKVNDTATSTLDSCTVKGDVYGGGYSASIPKIAVRNTPAFVSGKEPSKNINIGMFEEGEIAGTIDYEWKHVDDLPADGNPGTEDDKYVLTDENLTTLGQVKNSNLIIKGSTVVMGDVYGGGALASMDTDGETKVNLIGGTINGDVYGGGMGRLAAAAVGTEGTPGYVAAVTAVEAKVGNTNVNLNGIDATDYKTEYSSFMEQKVANGPYTMKDAAKGCVVKGNIFGCNNLNGTPKGSVTVHVYATQNASANQICNNTSVNNAKVQERFDVNAVYGGGNLAAYEPTDLTNGKTNVIIDGCDRTSIKQVYGGGNAASTPATEVTINGTFEVEEVFGGGNGKDDITINSETKPNPGANVGYKDYSEYTTEDGQLVVVDKDDADTPDERAGNYSYGSGEAKVNIYGGLIHRVYGGSNTKGNVRQIAVAMLEDEESCDFHVDEAYGGGKSANMDGEARLEMKCIPGLNAAYGGAENADISNNVTLNITNGKFGQVFGGNNRGGRIMGSITVNIEETGCRPVIIGELYGGGNRAGYSIYGYTEELEDGEIKLTDGKPHWLPLKEGDDNALATPYDSPQVNVKSFTSIGDVFGGGYGETAVMVGDPTVNINVVVGDKTSHDEAKIETEGTIELREDNEQGQEPIYRNVKYPTHVQGKIGAINNVFGGGNAAKVIGSPKVNVGTAEKVTYVTKATGDTNYREFTTGIGADIRGNVYGGGNNAEVTGDTDVQIGRKAN